VLSRGTLEGPEPVASAELAGVPPTLARIVSRALAVDPAKRFQTARDFELELRQYLSETPEANRAVRLQTILVGHFGGELAAIRRTIDEQLGSSRHTTLTEARSVVSTARAMALASDAPHAIGSPEPRPRRLGALSAVVALVALGLAVVAVSWNALPKHSPSVENAAVTAALNPANGPALLPAAESALAAASAEPPPLGHESAPGAAAPGTTSSPHQRLTATPRKQSAVPLTPRRTMAKETAFVGPTTPDKNPGVVEPGADLRRSPTKAAVRSLDEGDPYAP
jgi:hypothetical protein